MLPSYLNQSYPLPYRYTYTISAKLVCQTVYIVSHFDRRMTTSLLASLVSQEMTGELWVWGMGLSKYWLILEDIEGKWASGQINKWLMELIGQGSMGRCASSLGRLSSIIINNKLLWWIIFRPYHVCVFLEEDLLVIFSTIHNSEDCWFWAQFNFMQCLCLWQEKMPLTTVSGEDVRYLQRMGLKLVSLSAPKNSVRIMRDC